MPTANAFPPTEDRLIVSFGRALRERWWIIAAAAAVGLALATVYLRGADYVYTAELRIMAAPGTASRTPGLGGLSGLAAIAGVGLDAEATPFRLYLEDLTSFASAAALAEDKALMRQVFADEWQDGGWHEKSSLTDRLTADLLSRPAAPVAAWSPPNAARLQAWLQANLGIEQNVRSPVVVLRLNHRDPVFAKALLGRLHAAADDRARSRTLARVRANIAHLNARIGRVTELDHRQAMVATRAAEAQRLMMTRNPAPFAASRLGEASASQGPTSPRTGLVLALALVLATAIGVALALLLGPPRKRVGEDE